MLDDVLDIDFGENPSDYFVYHRRNVAVEVPPIENPHLLGPHEQGTGHVGTGREPPNVSCQQPCAGVGHAVLYID